MGRIDAGAYDAPDYEWGTASSPIIHEDKVIVQCDQQKNSLLLAADINTGETLWKVEHDEISSWATPNVFNFGGSEELVTNAPNLIRGYDPKTELGRLGGSSKITAPTPISNQQLIYVASGRRPEAPIFAIRSGATGDITLGRMQGQSESVVWHKQQRGSYMPTPILYENLLYVLGNAGIFDCYNAATGRKFIATVSPIKVPASVLRRLQRMGKSIYQARTGTSLWYKRGHSSNYSLAIRWASH